MIIFGCQTYSLCILAPTLMYFGEGGNISEAYDGPRDLSSIMEFVDEKTGRRPQLAKVDPESL